MRHSAVHWANGTFLRPHHFQSSDRHLTELISVQQQFDHPLGYGLLGVRIQESALVNGILELNQLQIRFREGMVVSQQVGDVHRLEIPMDAKELRSDGLLVYLAVPIRNEGAANVAVGDSADRATLRYVQRSEAVADESAGGDEQPILFRDYNFRFLFSSDDLNGYQTIPIARLIAAGERDSEAAIKVDPEYYPPCLSVQAWPELAALMRSIHDELIARAKSLAKEVLDKSITLSSQTQGDLDKLMLLHAINESSAQLGGLAFDQGIHPQTAFHGLCQCIGRLALFGNTLAPPPIPEYDHDHAAPLFIWARKVIQDYISSVKGEVYTQRHFLGEGLGMFVRLDPEWFDSDWQWYLGIHPLDSSQSDCLDLLRTRLDWAIGSKDEVDHLFSNRIPGVELRRLRQLPSFLRDKKGWIFFQLTRGNDAWEKVAAEKSLAIRVNENEISDAANLQGNKKILLKETGNTRIYSLEFAVFVSQHRQPR